MNLFRGYLTYAMAAIAVIFGLWNVVAETYVDRTTGLAVLWAGLAVFGIRRAID